MELLVSTALIRRRAELQTLLRAQRLSDEAIANLLQFREDVIVGMGAPTFHDKRQILERMDVKVRMDGDQFTIESAIETKIPKDCGGNSRIMIRLQPINISLIHSKQPLPITALVSAVHLTE